MIQTQICSEHSAGGCVAGLYVTKASCIVCQRDALAAENAKLRAQVARQSAAIKQAMGAYQQGVRDAVQPSATHFECPTCGNAVPKGQACHHNLTG